MHYCEDPYVFAQFVLQKEAFELSLFDDPDHLLRCLLWRHQLFTHHGPVQSLTKVKPNHSTCTIISYQLITQFSISQKLMHLCVQWEAQFSLSVQK